MTTTTAPAPLAQLRDADEAAWRDLYATARATGVIPGADAETQARAADLLGAPELAATIRRDGLGAWLMGAAWPDLRTADTPDAMVSAAPVPERGLPVGARVVAYAQEGIIDPDSPDRHMVAFVEEGEPGYWPTTYTGTLDYVRGVAASINEAAGLTPEDVTAVVASSMTAGTD